ncbi:hypothetical protein J6590_044732 [Homalodisca vitripennis]|nr:hypothetical protein J6590_044732 [Homalodisca vitripennis]
MWILVRRATKTLCDDTKVPPFPETSWSTRSLSHYPAFLRDSKPRRLLIILRLLSSTALAGISVIPVETHLWAQPRLSRALRAEVRRERHNSIDEANPTSPPL